MALEALPDDQAAAILAERESLGRLVQDLFKARENGERMIAQVAADAGVDPDCLQVDDASVTFTWHKDGRDYRLTLGLDVPDDSTATVDITLSGDEPEEPAA